MRISGQDPAIAISAFPPQSIHSSSYDTVVEALAMRRTALDAALRELDAHAPMLADIASQLVMTLQSGHKILVVGNGGSAAEAQHFAAELVGRFKRNRAPYAVLALTTDTAILTAVANDYGYQEVFARQVSAFGQPHDMLLAFSTSGQSENLLHAAQAARQHQMAVVAITGGLPSRLEMLSDVTLKVPLSDTALVQELHMIITHILCDIVETTLSVQEEKASLTSDAVHPHAIGEATPPTAWAKPELKERWQSEQEASPPTAWAKPELKERWQSEQDEWSI